VEASQNNREDSNYAESNFASPIDQVSFGNMGEDI
jgi:hypothetical protein